MTCIVGVASGHPSALTEDLHDVVQIGVITCEGFLVDIEQLVSGCHHECCSELSGAASCVVLTISTNE